MIIKIFLIIYISKHVQRFLIVLVWIGITHALNVIKVMFINMTPQQNKLFLRNALNLNILQIATVHCLTALVFKDIVNIVKRDSI